MHWQSQQRGVLRFNCADSLDRTNAASYFVAVQVGMGSQGSCELGGRTPCHDLHFADYPLTAAPVMPHSFGLQALVEQCRQLDIVVEDGNSTAQQPRLQHKAKLGSGPTQEPLVLPKVQ